MQKRPDPASPRIRTRQRGRWVFLFLLAGLVALLSAVAPSMGLPWVLASLSIVALSGYRIWRIDHPGESARYEIGWRVRGLLAAAGIGVLGLAFEVAWVWVLAAAALVGVMFLVIYALANRNPLPGPATPDFPPEAPRDDPAAGA